MEASVQKSHHYAASMKLESLVTGTDERIAAIGLYKDCYSNSQAISRRRNDQEERGNHCTKKLLLVFST